MCGIVGIVGKGPVNQSIYDALTVLQHRGQDAAGIATWHDGKLLMRKSNGFVRDVFRQQHAVAAKQPINNVTTLVKALGKAGLHVWQTEAVGHLAFE